MEHGLYELFYFPCSLVASWNVISLLFPPPLICGSNTAGKLTTARKVINQPTPGTHVGMHAHTNIYMIMKDAYIHTNKSEGARGEFMALHILYIC